MNNPVIADRIYVSWRRGAGERRQMIGMLNRTENANASFCYLPENLLEAFKNGFSPITAFPDLEKKYENVLPLFSGRLIDPERSDRVNYLKFWEASDDLHDPFDLVALTQAWLTNDRLEFLADFNVRKGLTFITDLAGQTHLNLEKEEVAEGDELSYSTEPDNEFDTDAVVISSGNGKTIGYIKQIHCKAFSPENLGELTPRITVHKREMNGKLRRLFVKCSFS